MKKIICILVVLAGFCAGLFAKSVIKEIDIKDVSGYLKSDEFLDKDSYTLQIKDNFKPEDVTVLDIKALSKFMSFNDDNKIEGPIEYIYFDGTHSAEVFYEIRQKIDNAKEKFVCVDFSVSRYFIDYYDNVYPLPKNCFAGHENLYWVYLGSFARKDVPANICKDCKNLQFVMMWDYEKVDDTAFSGVNKTAKLYDKYENESPLALIHQFNAEEYEDWDYLAFDVETFDEDNDFEDPFEKMYNVIYEKLMNQLSFSKMFGDDRLQISASNAKQILSDGTFDKTDFYSVAVEFLCNYILSDEKSDLETSLNDRYSCVFDLSDFVFHTSEKGKNEEEEDRAIVAVGIEGNGGAVRDICFLELKKDEEGAWSVSEFNSFCLIDLLLSTMFND